MWLSFGWKEPVQELDHLSNQGKTDHGGVDLESSNSMMALEYLSILSIGN